MCPVVITAIALCHKFTMVKLPEYGNSEYGTLEVVQVYCITLRRLKEVTNFK